MKRIICILLVMALVCGLCFALAGCGNRTVFDTQYTFTKAIVKMPTDEVLELDIREWRTYDGEQIQIITKDGTVYLTNSFNCVLINE